MGPLLVERALPAAPPPRPPQPTKATWTVLFPAAWTCGMATPANAETAANRPVFLRNSRRELSRFDSSFIIKYHSMTFPEQCQFRKFQPDSTPVIVCVYFAA